jgi:hypothetical protein
MYYFEIVFSLLEVILSTQIKIFQNKHKVFQLFNRKDNKYAIMGLKNGAIRIQTLVDNDFNAEAPHWTISSHDNLYGSVIHVELSRDNKFVFSVGADGNFFSYELMDQELVESKVKEAKAKIPSARLS